MNIRRALVSVGAATILVTGIGAGTALAQTSTPSAPSAASGTTHKHCDKAADAVAKLRAEVQKLDGRVEALNQAKGAAAGNDKKLKKIEGRLDKLAKHHTEVETRIDKIQKACAPGQ